MHVFLPPSWGRQQAQKNHSDRDNPSGLDVSAVDQPFMLAKSVLKVTLGRMIAANLALSGMK